VQASVLNRTFGCVRVVWNQTLAWRRQRCQADKSGTTYAQASAYLTAMKATEELAWLNEVSSVPLQQAIRHQQAACTAFFAKRARYPRFKSRQGRQCAEYTRSGFRWRDGALYLAKMDLPLAFTWSWPGIDPATIDPTTVTVSRDPCGRWYVSFAVDVPAPEPLPATGRAAGVDLGITDFAVTSDGQRIANPRHLERRARNLARYQRRLARCQRGSANRAKARTKVARAHRKVRAARTDFLHKASTGLVRDQPGAVGCETGTLAREGRNPRPSGRRVVKDPPHAPADDECVSRFWRQKPVRGRKYATGPAVARAATGRFQKRRRPHRPGRRPTLTCNGLFTIGLLG
jgi:putative transposase